MALTEDDRQRYADLLLRAEAAYTTLLMGGQVVDFQDQNGERVRYTAASRTDLLTLINWLRSQLGMCSFGMLVPGRPAGVLF